MSNATKQELEDLWAAYEVAQATYRTASKIAVKKAKVSVIPQRDAMDKAYDAYDNRSRYYRGDE
jgi:hypothetical protein